MIPDDPTEAQAKDAVLTVCPALLRLRDVYAAIAVQNPRGVVCWESMREHAAEPRNHLESLWAALCLGWQFSETDMRDEWLLIGHTVLTWLRQLPRFVPEEPVSDGKTVYIGKVSGVNVYTPIRGSTLLDTNHFYTGVARSYTLCQMMTSGQCQPACLPAAARNEANAANTLRNVIFKQFADA